MSATWQRRGLQAGKADEPKHVLVTGATGFIGRRLVWRLVERGDRISVLARNPAKAADLFGPYADVFTDLTTAPSTARVDAIVNLAGESIAGGLWTTRRRQQLLDSRLMTTRALLELVARLNSKPTTWINASAIGYYGARAGDEFVDDRTEPGTGFQAELCRHWEEAAAVAAADGVRVTLLRFGVVLGKDGGALPQLARPVRLFAGVVLGSGQQWFSWIHIDDLLELILFVLDEATLKGPMNATAPSPVRYDELMATLATTLRRPLWPVHVPTRLLRMALGELAELFVDGQRVVPDRAAALGFRWRYPTIGRALAAIYAPPGRRASGAR